MDTLNTSDIAFANRIKNAKQFLIENPTENKAVAARVFEIKPKTLLLSMRRGPAKGKGGQNKILGHQAKAIYQFIRSLLIHGIQPTHEVIFGAIMSLKRAQNSDKNPPTRQ